MLPLLNETGRREFEFLCGLCSIMLLIAPALADSSGTLALSGTVTPRCSLAVHASASAASLDLAVGSSNLLVATVTEDCRDKNGYTVTLTSNNGFQAGVPSGLLSGLPGNSDRVAYYVTYNGNPVALVNGSAIVTSVSEKTTGAGVTKDLAISYAGAPGNSAGAYSDTIVLSLVGN